MFAQPYYYRYVTALLLPVCNLHNEGMNLIKYKFLTYGQNKELVISFGDL